VTRVAGLALAALLYAAAAPPWSVDALAPVALVPVLLALRGLGTAAGFVIGAAYGVALAAAVTWWSPGMFARFFGIPAPLAALASLGMYLLCVGVPVGLFGAGTARLLDAPRVVAYAGIPALWVGGELVRTSLFTGLPWEFLGHALYRRTTLIQIADATGAYGLSWLCALSALAVADLLRPVGRGQPDRRRAAAMIAVAAACWGATAAYGRWRLAAWREAGDVLSVAVVQTNTPPSRDVSYMSALVTLARNARLTRAGVGEAAPGLVVWPENSAGFAVGQDPDALAALRTLADETRAVLLVGGPRREPDGLRNAAYAIDGDGILGSYDKVRLVPFAEYAPLGLRFLSAPAAVLRPGAGVRPVPSPGGPLGVMICYEVLYPRLARALVARGARLLVNISNDEWSDPRGVAAAAQHFSMAVFRAVEARRYLVRAATTGISGVIAPTGRSEGVVPVGVADVLRTTVRLLDGRSPYVRFGDAFAWGCVALAAVALAARRIGEAAA